MSPARNPDLGFLENGGQTAALIAAFDWSGTSLGPMERWPQTTRAGIALALRSPVPHVMMWGHDGVMIYNDAYSAIAGGRHPDLLGSKVREGWPEVADFNDNVMKRCLAGQTISYRDQELTLHRDGVPEAAWFDLDYSPIPDENGTPVGVMAIVQETTAKVKAERWRADAGDRMRQMFRQSPGFMAMLSGPEHRFELTNDSYMQLIGHRDVLGKTVREALPEIAGQGFFDLLDGVYASAEAFIGRAMKVELQRAPGAVAEERIVDFIFQPVLDPAGAVVGIFVEGSDVTERILAEQALRESEAQFRAFAEAMPNHVWTSPPDGQLDWFNDRVYEYGGADRGELDGEGWASMVHPDDLPGAAARWQQALTSGQAYEVEFRLRRSDGVFRWHIARAVPIRDAEDRLVRWIGTNTDIDDQIRATHALAESEARLKLAIEAGQLAVWDLDIGSRYITPSPAMNHLYGFPEDATPTEGDYLACYAPGEGEWLTRLGPQAASPGESDFETEARHLCPDGTEKWLLIRAQIVDDGKRALGVAIDITERKSIEQRLAVSEQRFRLSQDAAGIGSLELDIHAGTVIGSNRFWEIWGLEQRDSIPISALEQLIVPEDRTIGSNPQTRKDGTATPSVEYRIRRADTGAIRWLSRHIEFVRDEAGNPVKMFGVIQDVTERKEAQSRQRMLTRELEHRIKNILTMVSAIASQTLRNTDMDTARAAFTARLRALSDAHDILTGARWSEAYLDEVLQAAIAPLPADRIIASGTRIELPPRPALSLALAVHELGTNALKYGALSVPGGRVEVTWSTRPASSEDGQEMVWTWREFGGPPVKSPTRRGFGRVLIERVLAADFSGTVRIDYPAEGVICTLVAPLPDPRATG